MSLPHPRHVLVCVFALFSLSLPLALGQDWSPDSVGKSAYLKTPVWADEFNSPDLSKWYKEDQAWRHNEEMQFYSDDDKYSSTSNGFLTITATNDKNGGRDYTSARLSTKRSATFKHGMFAARMKMPEGQGIWPAFWLFGTGDLYSEIDIAEMVGGDAATKTPPTGSGDDRAVAVLTHFNTEEGGGVTQGPGASFHLPGNAKFSSGYHVFWMEWTEKEIWAGVDGDKQLIVADVSKLKAFENPMYIILNIAVGGSYPGAPDATTRFPQQLSVDWVRVYAKQGQNVVLSDAGRASASILVYIGSALFSLVLMTYFAV